MKTYLTLIMIALALPCWARDVDQPTSPGSIPETQAASSQVLQMPGFPVKIELGEAYGPGVRGVVLADINGDDALEVVHSYAPCDSYPTCEEGVITAWDYQGVKVPGFPVTTTGGAFAAPSVDDMDGDGDQEIVQITLDVSFSARLYVLDHQGVPLPGFPALVGAASVGDGATLHDLDRDGIMEIIYSSKYALHVFEIDGSQWSDGWPIVFDQGPEGLPAIGDVDMDGVPEIFIAEGGHRLHLLKPDGSELAGWPMLVPEELEFGLLSSAALADIDGDLDLEIVVAAGTGRYIDGGPVEVHLFHHDGTPMTGWPQAANNYSLSCTPVVTDLEGDGTLDIILGGSFASTRRSVIYAWDASGSIKPGFPYLSGHRQRAGEISMITVADIDGDGSMEIFGDSEMAGDDDQQEPACNYCGYLFGIDAQGRDLPGFPLRPFSELRMNGVNIGDVDGDGDYELAAVAWDNVFNEMNIHLYDLTTPYARSEYDWLTFHAANSRGGLQKRQYTGWRFVYSGSRRGGGR